MKKFDCNFDAIEIEAHQIVFTGQDGCGAGDEFIYEPVDIDKGSMADVWSVFGHLARQEGTPESRSMEGHGGGRELIADCETPEAAEFIAELVHEYLLIAGVDAPTHWYTDRPPTFTRCAVGEPCRRKP